MMQNLKSLSWLLGLYLLCEGAYFFVGNRIHGGLQPLPVAPVAAYSFPAAPIERATDAGFSLDCAAGNELISFSAGSIHHEGASRWEKVLATRDYDYPSMCVCDEAGNVFVAMQDKYNEHGGAAVLAFAPDGKQLWSTSLAGNMVDVMALAGADEIVVSESLYKPGQTGHFLERVSGNGNSLWRVPTSDVLLAVGPDGSIFCRRNQGGLVAHQEDGLERWASNPTTSDISAPAFDSHGNIYVTDWQGIYALDSRGVLRWERTALMGQPSGMPMDTDKDKGERKIMANAVMGGGAGINQPAIADDDTVYLAARSLYAFTQDGRLKWTFTPETHFRYGDSANTYFNRTPMLAQDGTIYITTYDHQLYAVTKDGKPLWRHSGAEFDGFGSLYLAPDGLLHLAHMVTNPQSLTQMHPRHLIFATREHGPLMKHAWPTLNHDFGNSRQRPKGD